MKTANIEDILNFSEEEKVEIEREMIHLDIMDQIKEVIGEMPRKELALRLGVSSAYVSKLFAGESVINLKLMAKFQRSLDVKFRIKWEKPMQHLSTITTSHTNERKLIKLEYTTETQPEISTYVRVG